MKKTVYLLFSALIIVGCSTDETDVSEQVTIASPSSNVKTNQSSPSTNQQQTEQTELTEDEDDWDEQRAVTQMRSWASYRSTLEMMEQYEDQEDLEFPTVITESVVVEPLQIHSSSQMSTPSYFEFYGNEQDGVFGLEHQGSIDWFPIVDSAYYLRNSLPDKMALIELILANYSSSVMTEDIGDYATYHMILDETTSQEVLIEVGHAIMKLMTGIEQDKTSQPLYEIRDLSMNLHFQGGQFQSYSLNADVKNLFVGEGTLSIVNEFDLINDFQTIEIPAVVFENATLYE